MGWRRWLTVCICHVFKQQFEDYIIYKMMLNSECQKLNVQLSLQNGIKAKKKQNAIWKYVLTIIWIFKVPFSFFKKNLNACVMARTCVSKEISTFFYEPLVVNRHFKWFFIKKKINIRLTTRPVETTT